MSEEQNASQASEAVTVTAPETQSVQPSNESVGSFTEATQPQVQEQYTPNFKFKYPKLDSNEQAEAEFDDWIRTSVNKENEAKVRDLYTKAYGMDFYKQKYGKINDQFKGYKDKFEPMAQTFQDLTDLYNAGDMDSFFKGLKIPEDKIYQYVLDKINQREMPPEQIRQREEQMELKRRTMMLEKENQTLQERYQQEVTQVRENQLGSVLTRPEVTQVASSFDQRIGRPGAFRDEVIKRGLLAYHTTGQDITPDQAVQEVMQLLGGVQPQQTATQAMQQNTQVAQKPVIPSVGSRSGSPAKRVPRSLEDLKKLAQTM